MKRFEQPETKFPEEPPPGQFAPPKSVAIDWERYEKFLEGSDLSEDQKQEFLQTLWGIIVSFVDLGFGVHPFQQASSERGCGQDLDLTEFMATHVVSSNKGKPTDEFAQAND